MYKLLTISKYSFRGTAAMRRTTHLLSLICAFISLNLLVNGVPLVENDPLSPIYVPALHRLSEIDKSSLVFDGDFKQYRNDNDWIEDESAANFVINDNKLVDIFKHFLATKETFMVVDNFCSIESEESTEKFLETIFSTSLFNEMTEMLAISTKTDKVRLEQIFKSSWSSSKSALRQHFCGTKAEFWAPIFMNGESTITVEDQIIKSISNNADRLVPFGITPEFEIAAATFCFISMSSQKKFRPQIYKCEFDLFPCTRAVVLNVLSDSGVITDLWYENSNSQSESPNATIKKERKKKRKPDAELIEVVQKMWQADEEDRLPESAVHFNFGTPANPSRRGGGSQNEQPQENLITSLDESIFERPIYNALIKIYNASVFHPPVCTTEDPFAGERLEIVQNFLVEATNSPVFKLAHEFLVSRGVADSDLTVFREKLFDDWFGNYSRCHGPKGSSGFEHVFCGEFRDTIVDGHHSWVNYWLSQQNGKIEYYGYYTYREKNIVTIRYKKEGYLKAKGGFLFRSSPAFDFSLFTVCYLTHRGNDACKFNIEGDDFWVTSFSEQCSSGQGTCIATTYPGTDLKPFASPDNATTTTQPSATTNDNITDTESPAGNETTTSSGDLDNTTTSGSVRSGLFASGIFLLFGAFLRFSASQIV